MTSQPELSSDTDVLRLLYSKSEVEAARRYAKNDFLRRIEALGFTVLPEHRRRWWGAA